jgi:hypothetical protein
MNQPRQFETFEADYRCAVCATSVGSKMDDDNRDFSLLLKGS